MGKCGTGEGVRAVCVQTEGALGSGAEITGDHVHWVWKSPVEKCGSPDDLKPLEWGQSAAFSAPHHSRPLSLKAP